MQPRTPLSPGVPRQATRGRGANDSNAAPSEPRCGSNDGSTVTAPHTHAHRRQSRPPLAPALSADLGQSVFIESLSATTSAPTLTKHRAKYAKPKAKPKPKQKNKPTKKPEKRVRKTGSAMSVTNAYPSPSSPPPHPFVTYRLQETVGQAVQDRQGNSLLAPTHPSLTPHSPCEWRSHATRVLPTQTSTEADPSSHPSWAASQKQKEQMKNSFTSFKGKKIVFD